MKRVPSSAFLIALITILNPFSTSHIPEIKISYILFFFLYLLIYFYFWLRWVFVAACGLLSSCSKRELLLAAVRRLLTAVASPAAEHGL